MALKKDLDEIFSDTELGTVSTIDTGSKRLVEDNQRLENIQEVISDTFLLLGIADENKTEITDSLLIYKTAIDTVKTAIERKADGKKEVLELAQQLEKTKLLLNRFEQVILHSIEEKPDSKENASSKSFASNKNPRDFPIKQPKEGRGKITPLKAK